MTDLTTDDVKSLGRAVGIELEEPFLADVTHNLNALKALLEDANPPGLEEIEPLPILLPPARN
jgi:hypothetical protein